MQYSMVVAFYGNADDEGFCTKLKYICIEDRYLELKAGEWVATR